MNADEPVDEEAKQDRVKRIGRLTWLLMIAAALVGWACFPNALTPASIRGFLQQYEASALLIYLLISAVRGCFLVPGTPFVLAGVLLFPDSKWLVFAISLAGVVIGDRCELEWFVGPHTINGKGTFDFLHKHLKWPKR